MSNTLNLAKSEIQHRKYFGQKNRRDMLESRFGLVPGCSCLGCPKWRRPAVLLTPTLFFFWRGGGGISSVPNAPPVRKRQHLQKYRSVMAKRRVLGWTTWAEIIIKLIVKCGGGLLNIRQHAPGEQHHRHVRAQKNQASESQCLWLNHLLRLTRDDWFRMLSVRSFATIGCQWGTLLTKNFSTVLSFHCRGLGFKMEWMIMNITLKQNGST